MPNESQQSIATKQAERRELSFQSTGEVLAELERLERDARDGSLRVTGNWSLGQQADHLARFWSASLDGFPAEFKPPFFVRWAAILLFKKRAIAGATPPPGFKLPAAASFLLPEDGVSTQDGLAALRRCIERTDAGESFVERSPLFGRFTREQWITINLSHCALHLSFAHPN